MNILYEIKRFFRGLFKKPWIETVDNKPGMLADIEIYDYEQRFESICQELKFKKTSLTICNSLILGLDIYINKDDVVASMYDLSNNDSCEVGVICLYSKGKHLYASITGDYEQAVKNVKGGIAKLEKIAMMI